MTWLPQPFLMGVHTLFEEELQKAYDDQQTLEEAMAVIQTKGQQLMDSPPEQKAQKEPEQEKS